MKKFIAFRDGDMYSNAVGVCAKSHETRVAQRELTGKAVYKVETDSQYHVDSRNIQDSLDESIDIVLGKPEQHNEDQKTNYG